MVADLNRRPNQGRKPGRTRPRIIDAGGLLLEVDPAGGRPCWGDVLDLVSSLPTDQGRQAAGLRIGPYPKISLKKPRQIRDEQKALMQQEGTNPCAAKKEARIQRQVPHQALNTFESIALDWHSIKATGTWSQRHTGDVLLKLQNDILPALGAFPIGDITTQDCLAVLRSIEKRGSPEQAKRTLGVISQVFDDGSAAAGALDADSNGSDATAE